jgi:peptide-methionine (R)-S-oxide reductase
MAFTGGDLLPEDKNGFYYCVACNNKLFSSKTKFNSGTGWPSFFKPVSKNAVIIKNYPGMGLDGSEVLCAKCEGHLGHIFLDGPNPTGQRFCMNAAILKFKEKKS